MKKTTTVRGLATRWSMSVQAIRNAIARGELIARDISPPGSKRATFRIDLDDADAYWDSISTRRTKRQRQNSPVADVSNLDFKDFI